MKLEAVSNRKLYIQIADQIGNQIRAGSVQPGHQLPSERDLATSLGVSRPTLREALIALEVAGLVEVRVGVGAFVKGQQSGATQLPESDHSPLEVMRARQLIEPEVARLAAENIDPEAILRLAAIIETMRAELAGGRWSAESDKALHLGIAEACGNAVLREILSTLWTSRDEEIDTLFHQHLAAIGSVRDHIFRDHEKIVHAIMARESEAAGAAMAAHLEYVGAAMMNAWD